MSRLASDGLRRPGSLGSGGGEAHSPRPAIRPSLSQSDEGSATPGDCHGRHRLWSLRSTSGGGVMAFIISSFEVDDYDAWKQTFDSDPGGRRQGGKGHRIFRGVANPNEVFITTEFSSAE